MVIVVLSEAETTYPFRNTKSSNMNTNETRGELMWSLSLQGYLKKLRRAEGGAKISGVFRVKNHDFTPKNHIFSNFRGWGARTRLDPPL
jgi:hypothetical protein